MFEEAPTIEGSETCVLDDRQSVSNDSIIQRPGRTHLMSHDAGGWGRLGRRMTSWWEEGTRRSVATAQGVS